MPIQAHSSMDSTNQIKARFMKSMTIDSTALKLFTKTPISSNQIHRKKSSTREHQSYERLWRKNIFNNGSTKIAPKIHQTRTRSGKNHKILPNTIFYHMFTSKLIIFGKYGSSKRVLSGAPSTAWREKAYKS